VDVGGSYVGATRCSRNSPSPHLSGIAPGDGFQLPRKWKYRAAAFEQWVQPVVSTGLAQNTMDAGIAQDPTHQWKDYAADSKVIQSSRTGSEGRLLLIPAIGWQIRAMTHIGRLFDRENYAQSRCRSHMPLVRHLSRRLAEENYVLLKRGRAQRRPRATANTSWWNSADSGGSDQRKSARLDFGSARRHTTNEWSACCNGYDFSEETRPTHFGARSRCAFW